MSAYEHFGSRHGAREAFTYPPEALAGDDIRVLEIEPGNLGAELRCTLDAFQRSSVGRYKALSYTWGTLPADFTVNINDKVFWIRENLKDALHRIRKPDQVVRLWVDAICINQDNDGERNTQVQRMGETYTHADEVLIWLGNPVHTPSILNEISELSSVVPGLARWQIEAKSSIIIEFFSNPWFVRLWVLQEVVLARNARIILGAEECGLLILSSLVDHVDKVMDALDSPAEGVNEALRNLVLLHQSLHFNQSLFGNEYVAGVHRNLPDSPSALESMVVACRNRLCQDPRDHIFGLVGMVQQASKESQSVDYTLSVSEVFQNLVKTALMRRPNTLIYLEAGLTNRKSLELPSWVPDLSQAPLASFFAPQFYFASGMDVYEDTFKEAFMLAEDVMEIPGFEFDIVEAHHFCEPPKELLLASLESDAPCHPAKQYGSIAEGFLDVLKRDIHPYGNRDGQLEACWRTFVGNVRKGMSPVHHRALIEDMSRFDESKHYNTIMDREPCPDPDREDEIGPFSAYCFSLVIPNRSLFVTERGYLGVGSHNVIAGDIVVVVPGLRMPLVLRKQPNNRHHLMVGVAYVHGIMKGEFIDSLSSKSKAAPQTYVIE